MKTTAFVLVATALTVSACQNLVRPEMTSLANGMGTQPNPALNMPVAIPEPATPQHGCGRG